MEGFKNTTRMKTFGDVAPQAYAKGGSVKPMAKDCAPAKKASAPMKKAGGGDVSKMTREQRMASMEKSSRAMTPAQAKSLQALKNAKDAAPKQGPLIKPARQMTPAERRMNQMDRPTNNMGAEAYKSGGKVGGSKVPFAVKKVMRKAEGGAVAVAAPKSQIPTLYGADYDPSKPASPPPMPTQETMQGYGSNALKADPSEIIRMKQATEMARLLGGTPPAPQEPGPLSVFGLPKLATAAETAAGLYGNSQGTSHPVMPSGYGTSPGPMPVMPEEPMMPTMKMPKPAFGGFDEASMPALPSRRFTEPVMPEYTPEMFARDQAQNAARAAALQAQQMQEQRDAAQIRREAAPRFMR